MVFNSQIIDKLKDISGLMFDKSKDFELLCDAIYQQTGRTIGITTIKRLMGYISDDRNTNDYTLNTIGIYLGYPSWEALCTTLRIDSVWNFEDNTYYVAELPKDMILKVKYLNRTVGFKVIVYDNKKALQVIETLNSSLKEGDILMIDHLKEGAVLEASTVIRGDVIGNYRTNGELTEIVVTN